MATTQKPTMDPKAFVRQGAAHRQEQHLPRVQAHLEGAGKAEALEKIDKDRRGGRPKLFEGPTVRLNLFVPEDTAKVIRHLAVEHGLSPSQLVDEWTRKAQLLGGIARGDRDFSEGRVVSQEEAERRLSKWG